MKHFVDGQGCTDAQTPRPPSYDPLAMGLEL